MHTFQSADKLTRRDGMISTELDQETVLMSIEAGAYYGMAGAARIIWEKLAAQVTFGELVQSLVEEYEISPEACSADLQEFLSDMEQEGLLIVE